MNAVAADRVTRPISLALVLPEREDTSHNWSVPKKFLKKSKTTSPQSQAHLLTFAVEGLELSEVKRIFQVMGMRFFGAGVGLSLWTWRPDRAPQFVLILSI